MASMSFVVRYRYTLIDYAVLLVVLAACVPLLVVVPDSRPYGATLIAWAFAFTFHLWRWLPWEGAYVRRSAHRRADRLMQERGVGRVHHENTRFFQWAAGTGITTARSLVQAVQRQERNCLPGGGEEEVDKEEDSVAWGLVAPVQQKLMQDSGDSTGSVRYLLPRITTGESTEVGKVDALTHVRPTATLMLQGRPLPLQSCISAAALESSSQFLTLSASALPARPSFHPVGTPGVMEEEDIGFRHSHEPFTHVSHSRLSSVANMLSSLSPTSLSDIVIGNYNMDGKVTEGNDADVGVDTTAVTLPSLSPGSSCRTHGYMPPSSTEADEGVDAEVMMRGTPASSSLLYGGEAPANVPRRSSVPSPRISIISSTVLRRDGFTTVPHGFPQDG